MENSAEKTSFHSDKDVSGHEATIDDPFEYTTDKPYVVVRFGQLWLYDSNSGQIIEKVRFDSQPTERSASPLHANSGGGRIVGGIDSGVPTSPWRSVSGKAFLFSKSNDSREFETSLIQLKNAFSNAPSSAMKTEEVEAACKNALSKILGVVQTPSTNIQESDYSGALEYRDVRSGDYLVLIIGRKAAEIGLWSGSVSVIADETATVRPERIVLCDDPDSSIVMTQLPTAEATNKALKENIEAGKTSPAAAAQLAQDGHSQTPQEQAQLIQNGQASKTAVITSPAGAEVYIDGNKGGVTPLVFVLIKRDAPRTITIKLAGYKTVEQTYVPDGKPILSWFSLKWRSDVLR